MKNALAPQLNQDFVFKATGTSPIIDIRGRGLGFFKIAYINNGVTAPSAGTIVLQKSSDGVTWSTGITATCTSDGQSLITAIDTSFLRLNLSTYTRASDSSLLVNIVGYITDPTLGSGDVVGPAIAIDSHIAGFDGTSGNLLKDLGALPAVAIPLTYLDTDGTLAANSDVKVASQKAVKTYVTVNAGGVSAPAGEILFGNAGGDGVTSDSECSLDTLSGFMSIPKGIYINNNNNITLASKSSSVTLSGSANDNVIVGIGEKIAWGLDFNVAIGSDALPYLTVGSFNIAIGRAGASLITGSHNIIIGHDADVLDSDYQLNIGNLITGTLSGSKTINID